MNKKILKDIPVELLTESITVAKDIRYLVRARIHKLTPNDENVFIATIYPVGKKEPMYRIFASKTEFCTELVGDCKWSECTIEKLLPFHYWERKIINVVPVDEESAICGAKFFDNGKVDTFSALYEFQTQIRNKALKERHLRIRKKTDSVMSQIKGLPKDIDKWINDVPLLESRYIYYKKKGKVIKGFCTECKTDVQVDWAKHNKPGRCPNCKSKITFKAEGIAKSVSDESAMAIVQRGTGDLEGALFVRCFTIYRGYYDYYRKPDTSYYEEARYLMKNGYVYMYEQKGMYNQYENDWSKSDWNPVKNSKILRHYYLYTKNLSKELKGTAFQYSGIKEYAKHEGLFNVLNYFDVYTENACIEYLVKLSLFNIADEVIRYRYWNSTKEAINLQGKSIKEVLGVEKTDIPFIKKMNLSASELLLYKRAKHYGRTLTADNIKWVRKYLKGETEAFSELLYYTTPHKATKYLSKQHIPKRLITNEVKDWLDYLENMQMLGYRIKSNKVVFPQKLKEAHDQAVTLMRAKKNSTYNGNIEKMEKELNCMYGYSDKKFLIRAPRSSDEIVYEGASLDHCVDTYIEDVANGETTILFIRKVSAPETPYYTMEVNEGKVIQCRGYDNCDMTAEVEKFVAKWKVNKLQTAMSTISA